MSTQWLGILTVNRTNSQGVVTGSASVSSVVESPTRSTVHIELLNQLRVEYPEMTSPVVTFFYCEPNKEGHIQ